MAKKADAAPEDQAARGEEEDREGLDPEGPDGEGSPGEAEETPPPGETSSDYWQAVIAALPPAKQAAAWRFFQERELGAARGATDTLSGLVLLMEANGLFMDACARRLAAAANLPSVGGGGGARQPPPLTLEGLRAGLADLAGQMQRQMSEGLTLHRAEMARGQPAPGGALAPASAKAAPRPPRRRDRAAPWVFAAVLGLASGALGTYFAAGSIRRNAEAQTRAQVRRIAGWIDADERARVSLMGRSQADLTFGVAQDAEHGSRSVYTLTLKGVPIVRAGTTKEGAAVIAWDAKASGSSQ